MNMKKIVLKKFFIISVILPISCFLYAQTDFRNGYIIKLNRDSIVGKIDFRGDMKNSISCSFTGQSRNIIEYKPGEIAGYKFINGKYYISKYVSRKENTDLLFVEYLVKGQKNLYYFSDNAGFHFLVDLKGDTLSEIPYHEEYINKDGRNYLYESKSHIGSLKTYFSDCSSIFDEIDHIKKPGFDNLISLTKKYHHLTCGDTGCIVYYKPEPLVKIAIEPWFGKINFAPLGLAETKYLTQIGGMLYLWLPRSNERLFFKTGVSVTKYTGTPSFLLLKVPLQFEYLFPSKGIIPKIDLGVNYYSVNYTDYGNGKMLTFATSLGVLFKLAKFMYIDLSINSDLFEFTFDTDFFLSNAIETGIYFKF
jgi:hypothetical protein